MPVKNIVTDLSEPIEIVRFGPAYKIMLCPKLSRGSVMMDFRMWKRWSQYDNKFHPGSNGIMMEKAAFILAINRIKEILDAEIKEKNVTLNTN